MDNRRCFPYLHCHYHKWKVDPAKGVHTKPVFRLVIWAPPLIVIYKGFHTIGYDPGQVIHDF
jgi:hypothetical protein